MYVYITVNGQLFGPLLSNGLSMLMSSLHELVLKLYDYIDDSRPIRFAPSV
jgi:hypothetical protein